MKKADKREEKKAIDNKDLKDVQGGILIIGVSSDVQCTPQYIELMQELLNLSTVVAPRWSSKANAVAPSWAW